MAVDKLIYDVGVNDGSDSAYYLWLGFRVVGIEASPVLAERLRKKFVREIEAGTYVLCDVGISKQDGFADFWMSDVTEWSSFNREIASRNGTPCQAVKVPTRSFSSILQEHGVPHYCKIDIEGNDRLCLDGFKDVGCPKYVSIEMSHANGGSDLQALYDLGYRKFKVVSQVTRSQPVPALVKLDALLSGFPKKAFRAALKRTIGGRTVAGWTFPWGSSGAFGEASPGPWRTYDYVRDQWTFLKKIDERAGSLGLGEWFDFHAKL